MTQKKTKNAPPPDDLLLSYQSLALRWDSSVVVVRRRVRAAKIPIVRISYSTVRVRLSDVLKFEAASVSNEPSDYQKRLTDAMHAILRQRKLEKEKATKAKAETEAQS